MKFRFSPVLSLLDTKGRMVRRPILILELKTKDGDMRAVPALLDSGADRTQVNFEYADILGIELNQRQDSVGIGNGQVEGYVATLPLKIQNTNIEMEVPATFIKSRTIDILLGRESFFEAFKIIFESKNDTFELIKAK